MRALLPAWHRPGLPSSRVLRMRGPRPVAALLRAACAAGVALAVLGAGSVPCPASPRNEEASAAVGVERAHPSHVHGAAGDPAAPAGTRPREAPAAHDGHRHPETPAWLGRDAGTRPAFTSVCLCGCGDREAAHPPLSRVPWALPAPPEPAPPVGRFAAAGSPAPGSPSRSDPPPEPVPIATLPD